jgi:hypothetical protein
MKPACGVTEYRLGRCQTGCDRQERLWVRFPVATVLCFLVIWCPNVAGVLLSAALVVSAQVNEVITAFAILLGPIGVSGVVQESDHRRTPELSLRIVLEATSTDAMHWCFST